MLVPGHAACGAVGTTNMEIRRYTVERGLYGV